MSVIKYRDKVMPQNVKHAGLRLPRGRQAQPGLSAGRGSLEGVQPYAEVS